MQRRNAAQNYYYFGLLLVGVLLGTVSRRLELLWAVLPLTLALIAGRLLRPHPRLTVSCTVAPQRAFEDDRLTVEISVHAAHTLPPTELWHLLPPEAQCPPRSNRFLFTLRAGETRTFQHEVTFPQRGRYTLGQLYCRVHPGPDLLPLLATYHCEQACTIYPRIASWSRHLLPWHTHVSFGNYVSNIASEGLEFAGIRAYRTGDRLRRVHWRVSLIRQGLYVNDYYAERNADIVILLDTLAPTGMVHRQRLDAAVRIAASLATHYLQQKDRVGLISYGGVCTWVPPGLGRRQVYRILDALVEVRPHFSYLTRDIALIPPRVLPPKALIFAITSLLDARIETPLHDLLARAYRLVLLLVPPPPEQYWTYGAGHLEAAQRLWRLETEMRVHEFRRLGVPVILLGPEAPEECPSVGWRGRVWRQPR